MSFWEIGPMSEMINFEGHSIMSRPVHKHEGAWGHYFLIIQTHLFFVFSITCGFNSKFDTKFVLAIIFFEKITLKLLIFP